MTPTATSSHTIMGYPPCGWGVRDLTDEDVARIDHQVGVIHTQLVTSTMVEHDDSDLLLSSWEPGSRINVPQVTAGHPIDDASGVWLDDAYADTHGVTPGDTLTVTTPAGGMDITVQGLIIQPDKMAYTGRGFVAPDRQAHGYGVASADILTELTGHGAVEHSLTLVAEPQRQHAVEQHIREALGDRLISSQTATITPTWRPFSNEPTKSEACPSCFPRCLSLWRYCRSSRPCAASPTFNAQKSPPSEP